MANFGIDLLFASQKANIRSPHDVLMIAFHWMLCKNNLRSCGLGDNKIFNVDDQTSELLPEGWNDDGTKYILRYTDGKQIFIAHGIVTDDSLLINLLDGVSIKTESLVLETKKIVKSLKGSTFNDFVVDGEDLIKRLNDEIVEPLLKKTEAKTETTSSQTQQVDPLMVGPPRYANPPDYLRDHRDPLFNIGRGDLDPLGRGGGGMIFQPPLPFRPGFGGPNPSPFGGRGPPGARYDPPNPFNRLDPDNDHLPPPGLPPSGYDDMFM